MELKKELYNKQKDDKIKINWNKHPIQMDTFLSFLTVEVCRDSDCLGSDNGWTLLKNEELKLEIRGGVIKGIEYLDSLQFGIKLTNPYNNFVNPFYLFEIFTKEGQSFFIDYYEDDIYKILNDCQNEIGILENKIDAKKSLLVDMKTEVNRLARIKL